MFTPKHPLIKPLTAAILILALLSAGCTYRPEQARALEEQYGSMKSLIMEQVDTTDDGELYMVVVRYERSKGVLEFETDYRKGAALNGYMYEMIITKIQ